MKATIAPTGYGTYGITWTHFPSMQRRGGYSGPFATVDEAKKKAKDMMEIYAFGPATPQEIEVLEVTP